MSSRRWHGIVGDDLSFSDENVEGDFSTTSRTWSCRRISLAAGGEGGGGMEDHGGVDVESENGSSRIEFGVVEEGGEEEDFLACLGERGVVAVGPESDQVEEFIHFGLEGAAGDAAEAAGELEVFTAREVGIEVGFLGDVPQAALEGL